MDGDVTGTHHSPAALGLGAAEGGAHVRHRIGHAGGMRYGIEAVACGDRADLHRLEEDVVAGIARHAGLRGYATPAQQAIGIRGPLACRPGGLPYARSIKSSQDVPDSGTTAGPARPYRRMRDGSRCAKRGDERIELEAQQRSSARTGKTLRLERPFDP